MPSKRSDVAERLLDLFFVRRDVYGLEAEDGWRTVKKPVTAGLVKGHLEGRYCLGAHPIGRNGECRWIGWEIDSATVLPPLYTRLKAVFPESAMVIHTTGGRSYHIKVFFKCPISSEDAYRIAKRMAGDLRGVEFYPKQPGIGRGYGNFMRLPLGRHGRTGRIGVLIRPESLFDVAPCMPPAPPVFSSLAGDCPYRVQEAWMVNGRIELLDEYSCTYHNGSIGRCKAELCPKI